MNVWTDARKIEATRLWNEEGLSAGAIAERLGEPLVTRNAVLGVLHREKHKGDAVPLKPVTGDKLVAERRRQLRQRDAGLKKAGGIAASKPRPRSIPMPVQAKTIQPVPEPTCATNVPLTGLEYGMCRYPIGPLMERATLFCGGPVREGHSWCGFHAERCYQPKNRREAA